MVIENLTETAVSWASLIGGAALVIGAVVLGIRAMLKSRSGESSGGMKGLLIAFAMVLLGGLVIFGAPQLAKGFATQGVQLGEDAGIEPSDSVFE